MIQLVQEYKAFGLYWAKRLKTPAVWKCEYSSTVGTWASSGWPSAPADEDGVSRYDSARVSVIVTPEVMHSPGCHGICVCMLSVWPYWVCRFLDWWHVGASKRTPHEVVQRGGSMLFCRYCVCRREWRGFWRLATKWRLTATLMASSLSRRPQDEMCSACSPVTTAKSRLASPLSGRACPSRAA